LNECRNVVHAVREPLREILCRMGNSVIGFEASAWFQPGSYAAMHIYGASMPELLWSILPDANLRAADPLLAGLRSRLTPLELARLRHSCAVAESAFSRAHSRLQTGISEAAAANLFQSELLETELPSDERMNGFVWCMSGPNSARASAAFQVSGRRKLARGELALVHCNAGVDGFWTDITRTFCFEPLDRMQRRMFAAISAAAQAAVGAIRPGVKGSDVDRAARQVLADHGFGGAFRHATGHGVGFAAINHNASPRMHPMSADVLQTGMVFNVEPGIYFDGSQGMRLCDMVVVTDHGAEILTPGLRQTQELIVPSIKSELAMPPEDRRFVPAPNGNGAARDMNGKVFERKWPYSEV
jgi:Xaa-Pro aminopeptidase